MQLTNTTTKVVYYCLYTRNTDEPARLSQPFSTWEEARDEATALQLSGYWGMIERHVEATYDDETHRLPDTIKGIEHF